MSFAFDCDYTADNFRSISSLIKYNNGVFKSPAQKKFFEKTVLMGPVPEGSEIYGIPLETGARYVVLNYTTRWADYGARSVIPGAFIIIFDEAGVVAKIKMPYNGNLRDGARPAPERAVTQWVRPEGVVVPDFAAVEAKRIEEEAAAAALTNYIGVIGDRVKIVGKVVSVREFEKQKFHFYDSGIGYVTTLDVNGDTVTYFGELKDADNYADAGDTVEFMARVKDHQEYKGRKQTVVMRPTKVVISKKVEEVCA